MEHKNLVHCYKESLLNFLLAGPEAQSGIVYLLQNFYPSFSYFPSVPKYVMSVHIVFYICVTIRHMKTDWSSL